VKAEQQLVDATADTLRLATQRFQSGVDDYLPVLEAQQSLYIAQQTLLLLKQARLSNLVTLYKVLGGGWHEHIGANDSADMSRPL
jgi:multidrug efflux system outer membrane protein